MMETAVKIGMYLMLSLILPFWIVPTIAAEKNDVIIMLSTAKNLKSLILMDCPDRSSIRPNPPWPLGRVIDEVIVCTTCKSWYESAKRTGAATMDANEMNMA